MDTPNQDQEKKPIADQTKVVPEAVADTKTEDVDASIAEKVSELTKEVETASADLGTDDIDGETEEERETSKTPIWQWIILAILILAITGVLVWYFFIKDKKPSSQAPPEENSVVENIVPPEVPEEEIIVPPEEPPEEPPIDSDGDGLTDDDELNIWQTDPNNPDTDGDGYLDGEEVNNGYNPNGEGTIEVGGVFEAFLATPEGVLDAFAQAFNTSDVDLLVSTLSADHPDYQNSITDGAGLIAFMQSYFENKTVSFEIIESTEGETPDILDLQVVTKLDGEFFQQDPMKMIKINEEWKILE